MPGTDEHDMRKTAEQEAEHKRRADEKSADQRDAVKEPDQDAKERQAGKIIGNG